MSVQIGEPAPQFALYNTEKIKVQLSDFHNQNLLILFFPLAFTSVCTKELCDTRDNLSKYESLHCSVIGISVDSLYSLRKYREELGLNFQLLSDFNKEISKAYGCLYDEFSYEMKGVSKRSAFIIDRGGILRYAEVLENSGKVPNFQAIERTLLTFA